MIVKLVRDGESATIEGDDDLIRDDSYYRGTFEKNVKLVTENFYKENPIKDFFRKDS